MPPTPSLKASEVVKTFQKFGWQIARQRGSHIIMVKEGAIASLSIPNHNPVARGTLRSLIRCANMSVSEFTSA
ncbi:MAG: type II toxin-antitoxin system HicA family toxin [Kiritimatiellia bacterium]